MLCNRIYNGQNKELYLLYCPKNFAIILQKKIISELFRRYNYEEKFYKTTDKSILAVCFTLAFPALSFAADSNQSDGEAKSESIYNEFKKSDGELICVSKYGDTDKFPENSAEAVAAAAEKGADIVYVSVKKTSDGYVVLMADSNLSRMCVDELGNTVNKDIGDVGYHELSTYHLRAGTGSLPSSGGGAGLPGGSR